MTPRSYSLVAGIIFFLVAFLHALRLLRGWQVVIGDVTVPASISWLGLVIAGYLASRHLSVVAAGGVGTWETRSVFHISMPLWQDGFGIR